MCCNQAYLLLWKNTASMQSLLCGILSVPALRALGFLGSVWHSNMLSGTKAKDHASFSWKLEGFFSLLQLQGVWDVINSHYSLLKQRDQRKITESMSVTFLSCFLPSSSADWPHPFQEMRWGCWTCILTFMCHGTQKCGFPCAQVKGY